MKRQINLTSEQLKVYDQMRKEDYSEDYQIEVISEIQKILINELKILK